MKLAEIFNDENHINEKSLIGVVSFVIMIIYSLVDVVYAMMGKPVEINETIYRSFETIVLGAFLISSGEKIVKIVNNGKTSKRNKKDVRKTEKGEGTEEEGTQG